MAKNQMLKMGTLKKETMVHEFESIHEFLEYINTTPRNTTFINAREESSRTGDYEFTQTHNYQEAENLLTHGWSEKAEELERRLNLVTKDVHQKTTRRSQFDVIGFQASVPRYLQGIPTNMVNQKVTTQKQKIITINKDIYYTWVYTKEQIMENSIKALQIVKKLEAEGYRVNLNTLFGAEESFGGHKFLVKTRIKSANERLNISKVAFPLVHPSMSRRLGFKYIEVSPNTNYSGFPRGYGRPLGNNGADENLAIKNEILLPRIIDNIDDIINKITKK